MKMIIRKSTILLTACLLLLTILALPAMGWVPPCPPCNYWFGECIYYCEPNWCETCVDGSCQVCGGDPDKVCCDGTCCDTDDCEKTCVDGSCQVCGGDPDCECVDGECLCCWRLQEHPQGTGDCACSEGTGHCGTYIEAWSISTCERSSSGSKYCNITYRQVGSRYACDESTDWVNLFLCYSGQAAQCVAICSWGSAECVASGFDPMTCTNNAISCQNCMLDYLEGEPEDCGCLVVICDIGAVTHTIWANAGTLSGGSCP